MRRNLPVLTNRLTNRDLKHMPYYLFKVSRGPTALIKQLEKLEEFAVYKDARNRARDLRSMMQSPDEPAIKVIFAASELEAEELLMEKREAPILKEWEK